MNCYKLRTTCIGNNLVCGREEEKVENIQTWKDREGILECWATWQSLTKKYSMGCPLDRWAEYIFSQVCWCSLYLLFCFVLHFSCQCCSRPSLSVFAVIKLSSRAPKLIWPDNCLTPICTSGQKNTIVCFPQRLQNRARLDSTNEK